MRRGFLILGLAALAAVGWFFFGYGSRNVPPGQPPLVHLNATTLEAMRSEFNAMSAQTRLLVLFSPT